MKKRRAWLKWSVRIGIGVVLVAVFVLGSLQFVESSPLRGYTNGELEGADYWRDTPEILAGGMGFDNIIGLPDITEASVRAANGSWYAGLVCTSGQPPEDGLRTSAAAADTIPRAYEGYAENDDGLPIEFSWPVAGETVDPTDFRFTLNTGEVVVAHAAGLYPNWERNERNTVVFFGDFGNRLPSADPGARFPIKVEVVADDTPLQLIGPDGQQVSAVGLSWTTDLSPYDRGPSLVGAKLNATGEKAVGEGGVTLSDESAQMPNDEFSLYGNEGDFRLRVLTTGGFSPDGVTGVRPDMFEDFFRLHVRGPDGETVVMDKVGVDYEVAGGTLRVVGLSDLGRRESHDNGVYYDDCYAEDQDNYIDIILAGDGSAARNVEYVEIPAIDGGAHAFYNPGGPGPEPYEGVRYTAPGPADLEPVTIALDDPMRVSRAEQADDPPYFAFVAAFVLTVGLGIGIYVFVRRRRS